MESTVPRVPRAPGGQRLVASRHPVSINFVPNTQPPLY